MKLSGEGQAELIRIAAILAGAALAAWLVKRQLTSAASAAGDYVDNLLDSAAGVIADTGAAVKTAAVNAYDVAFMPRAGTDGWQFFPMEGVAIDPKGNYWRGTRIIWSPEW